MPYDYVPGRRIAVLALAMLGTAVPLDAQVHDHPAGNAAHLGTVTFPVSCANEVAADFAVGVAMLHSFWFVAADSAFAAIAERDPQCAMAHWGRAVALTGNPMTRAAPSAAALAEGRVAIERAHELEGTASHREQMYIDAVQAYYTDYETRDHMTRMHATEDAFAALHAAHPEDMEATIFYARTMVANAPPDDKTFARQLEAARLMEPLFERHPDHPGLAHYLIHAYDAPPLASEGATAAFAYAGIAPAAPHALHMPSHIFTRLGYWDESIATNARSAQAEPDPNAAVHPMDYMVYAFLQQGRDAEAHDVVTRAVQNDDRLYGGLLGYNFTAMPARYALERDAWTEAAGLRVPVGALPYVEAITHFARGIGAARSDNVEPAVQEVAALEMLAQKLEAANDSYWTTIVNAQRLAVSAWIEHARGNDAEALRLAQEASRLEGSVEKHPVTPGPILPARELEGDLLLALGQPAQALAAYNATLEVEPRRARALAGAARAAADAGDAAAAATYYGALLDVMAKATAERPALQAARAYLARRCYVFRNAGVTARAVRLRAQRRACVTCVTSGPRSGRLSHQGGRNFACLTGARRSVSIRWALHAFLPRMAAAVIESRSQRKTGCVRGSSLSMMTTMIGSFTG